MPQRQNIGVGQDFLLAQSTVDETLALLHMSSQKVFPLLTETIKSSQSVVFTPRRVFLFSLQRTIEVFLLPDASTMPGGTPISRTHCGTIPLHYIDPAFISDTSEDGQTSSIWFTALFTQGARPLRMQIPP
ncbi:hypothetical protein D9757_000492 [Collybiopsis confluens]|uniref:Uncharacterized protein n=1 Tax=Collybiopsis confluens TaxID=2823264 RepID=A0A8H5I1V8_9AGAR|nr:hypothetical protein D9757_000492 [Collybiopsis confluens]